MPPPRLLSFLPVRALPRTPLRPRQLTATTTILRNASSDTQHPNPIPPLPTYNKSVALTHWPPEPLIPPPKRFEVMTERKANRALPPKEPRIPRDILYSFPIFVLIMTISALGIFNYQRQNSSVVTSTLYALRTNDKVRELLGDEIYFQSKFPWISGEINQVHGRIDITYWIKGTRGVGQCRFMARRRKTGEYDTLEWSLKLEDGTVMQLYETGGMIGPLSGSRYEDARDVATA